MINNYTGSSLTASTFCDEPKDLVAHMEKMMRDLNHTPVPPPVRIIMVPDQPKFQISPDCPLTPEFRDEMNAWCLSFFGTTNYIPDGEMVVSHTTFGQFMYANPRTCASLEATFGKTKQPSTVCKPSWPIGGYDPSEAGWIR